MEQKVCPGLALTKATSGTACQPSGLTQVAVGEGPVLGFRQIICDSKTATLVLHKFKNQKILECYVSSKLCSFFCCVILLMKPLFMMIKFWEEFA